MNPADIAAINPDALLRAAVDAIRDPEIVDEETIDGEPTTVVEGLLDVRQVALAGVGTPAAGMETPAAGDLPDPLLVQIWIDAEGRVVRLQLDGPLTDAEAANVVRRLDLSAFDEEVDIQPPGRCRDGESMGRCRGMNRCPARQPPASPVPRPGARCRAERIANRPRPGS